jgi:organic hydroperoxide reductase OsmC/OhrA
MSHYTATIVWERKAAVFTDNRYSRTHVWLFDGGSTVPASASPSVVPLPMSDASAVDPEEAFVASVASCHMLWFLSLAAKRGFVVESYRDEVEGLMEKSTDGKLAITVVTLRPLVIFSGSQIPSADQIKTLHHLAHEECFIARSIKSTVRCEPRFNES